MLIGIINWSKKMIQYKSGNILDEKTQAIVNTVNCVGVMGRGIALEFKNRYPDNFRAYALECKRHQMMPGKMFIHPTGELDYPQYIINFPTKLHWKEKSQIEYIQTGLEDLVRIIDRYQIRSIAVPPLGCGLGGLSWSVVKPLIERSLGRISDLSLVLYEPSLTSLPSTTQSKTDIPQMTTGRAVLLYLMHTYKQASLDPHITLLEIQKLMYFAQESGVNLKLAYSKGLYGPYANNLRHVLLKLEGTYTYGYGVDGDDPTKTIDLLPGSIQVAQTKLAEEPITRERIQRVQKLVEGFETPLGLELLATVHWIASKQNISDNYRILQEMHAWNTHKQIFTPRQIMIAYEPLSQGDWLTKPSK